MRASGLTFYRLMKRKQKHTVSRGVSPSQRITGDLGYPPSGGAVKITKQPLRTFNMKIIVLDTETTGIEDAEICEIAWIEIDENLEVIAEFSSLIKPPIPIPCDAAGVHGIRDEDVKDSPVIEDIDFFPDEEVCLIAHNVKFDKQLVEPYLDVVAECDTLLLAKRLLRDAPNHQLQTLGCYCDFQPQLSHRAIYDCRYVLGLLEYLMEGTGWTLPELINYSNTPQIVDTMPFGKHKGLPMSEVPKSYIRWLKGLDDLDMDMKLTLKDF